MLSNGILLDNRYEIIKVLGRGGMSTVYLTKDKRLNKYWAVKEVNNSFRNQIDLLAEPNILKQLNHSGIPKIIDIFNENDNLYIVEDYIEGKNLEQYIKMNANISDNTILSIASELCEILEYLHGLNPPIIYRDLKPQNIIISKGQQVTLVDFGISRVYKANQNMDTVAMGTKGYAAPEQYGINQSDIRSDIYGLGAVMFFIVNKRSPNSTDEPIQDESYRPEISKEIRDIIKRCTQIVPEYRYESVNNLKRYIDSLISESDKETKVLDNTIYNNRFDRTEIMEKDDIKYKAKLHDWFIIKGKKKVLLSAATLFVLLLCFSGFSVFNQSYKLMDNKGSDVQEEQMLDSAENINKDAINMSNGEDAESIKDNNNQVKQPQDNKESTIKNNNDLKNWENYKKYLEELKKNYDKSKGKGKNKHN
jgi:serine/threonine protein kinase